MRKVTIKDVAKKSGVAVSTVSLVINNKFNVHPDTRARVTKVVKQLNYYSSETAKMLVTQKSNEIAFISTSYAGSFIAPVLEAFEWRSRKKDKYIFGIRTYSTQNKADYINKLLKSLLYSKNIDGVAVLTQPVDKKIEIEYSKRDIPIVLIENSSRNAYSLNIDVKAGVKMAVNRFILSGRKRIGLISGYINPPAGEQKSPAVIYRYKAFVSCLKKHNIEFDINDMFIAGLHNHQQGVEAFEYFKNRLTKLDAIFCAAGDLTAMGFMQAATEYGVKIPDDLAIIGYDDLPVVALLSVPLTTVRQPVGKLGEMAFDMLTDAIEKKIPKNTKTVVKPELVIRKSG